MPTRKILSLISLIVVLVGCSSATPSTSTPMIVPKFLRQYPFLQRTTVEQAFAQTKIPPVDNTIAFYCGVFEGPHCYSMPVDRTDSYDFMYDPELENNTTKLSKELAYQIIDDLDPKQIDHTPHTAVLLRCRNDNGYTCEITSGSKWQAVNIP